MSQSAATETSQANVNTEISQLAIKNSFVADALAMPVHWYYRVSDIHQAFPEGMQRLYAAPAQHPSSIMSLHSKQQGGRQHNTQKLAQPTVDVVGGVILKGKEPYWNQANVHYHQGMQAGQNTLNAYTVLWLLEAINSQDNQYREESFLTHYIEKMTADVATHPDTYAESYHRGFFANWQQGVAANQCAAVTHDTSSVGGLVRIGPLTLFLLSQGLDVVECKSLAAMHLKLTHPDAALTQVCFQYIDLIAALLNTDDIKQRMLSIESHLKQAAGGQFKRRPVNEWADNQVVGGIFSTACYITDSWPSVLYLAAKYPTDSRQALQVNAELGGDNVHRGSVLAVLLTLLNHQPLDDFYAELELSETVDALLQQVFIKSGI